MIRKYDIRRGIRSFEHKRNDVIIIELPVSPLKNSIHSRTCNCTERYECVWSYINPRQRKCLGRHIER